MTEIPPPPLFLRTEPQVELRPTFPVLDPIRAIGALAVLTTHTAFQSGDYLRNGVFGTLLARLDVGVAIFFVLSGFLLSRPFLARGALGLARQSTHVYLAHRILRIFPVYLVTVVVALTFLPDNRGAGPLEWLSSVLMIDSYTQAQLPHGLTHMWSLAVEVAFYLVLPGLMLLVVSQRRLKATRILALLIVMVGISVFWHAWGAGALDPYITGSTGIWLPAYLTWFAVGIALATAHVKLQAGSRSRMLVWLPSVGRLPGACWAAIAGIMLVASTSLAGPILFQVGTAGESLLKHLLYAVVGGLVVITGIWAGPSRYTEVMSWRVLRHLGHISYSVFCIHLVVISMVMGLTGFELFRGNGIQIWLLTLSMTLVIAEMLYWGVERPALKFKRRTTRSDGVAPTTADTLSTTT